MQTKATIRPIQILINNMAVTDKATGKKVDSYFWTLKCDRTGVVLRYGAYGYQSSDVAFVKCVAYCQRFGYDVKGVTR